MVFEGGGLVFELRWWARREEIVGPREDSGDEGFGDGDGGGLGFCGERGFVGKRKGFGGEELGVISRRGIVVEVVARMSELEFSGGGSRVVGVSLS